MNIYKYKNLECGVVFCVVCAKDILTADALCKQSGINPTNSMVSCQILFDVMPKNF